MDDDFETRDFLSTDALLIILKPNSPTKFKLLRNKDLSILPFQFVEAANNVVIVIEIIVIQVSVLVFDGCQQRNGLFIHFKSLLT